MAASQTTRVGKSPTDAGEGGARITAVETAIVPESSRRWSPRVSISGQASSRQVALRNGATDHNRMVPQHSVGTGMGTKSEGRLIEEQSNRLTGNIQLTAGSNNPGEPQAATMSQQVDTSQEGRHKQKRRRSGRNVRVSHSTPPTRRNQRTVILQADQPSEETIPMGRFPIIWRDNWKSLPVITSVINHLTTVTHMKTTMSKYRKNMQVHHKKLQEEQRFRLALPEDHIFTLRGFPDLQSLIAPLGVRNALNEMQIQQQSSEPTTSDLVVTVDIDSLLLLYINKLCTVFKTRRATLVGQHDLTIVNATIQDCWETVTERCRFPQQHSSSHNWHGMVQNIRHQVIKIRQNVVNRRVATGMTPILTSSSSNAALMNNEQSSDTHQIIQHSSTLMGCMMQIKHKHKVNASDDAAIALDLHRKIQTTTPRTVPWQEIEQRFPLPSHISTDWAIKPEYPTVSSHLVYSSTERNQSTLQGVDNQMEDTCIISNIVNRTVRFQHDHMHGMECPIQEPEEVEKSSQEPDHKLLTPVPGSSIEDGHIEPTQCKNSSTESEKEDTRSMIELMRGQQNIMFKWMQSSQVSRSTTPTLVMGQVAESKIVGEVAAKPIRTCTQYKDFKKQSLPMLRADLLKDPEQWFLDFEQLLEEQNVHEGDYISCLYNCCHPSFKQNLMGRLSKDTVQRDYVQLRQFIATIYGPKFPLLLYLESAQALPRNSISVSDQLSHIQGCCDKYHRAWLRYNPTKRRQHPELDEDLCFNVLMRFMMPFAPSFVALLQRQYQVDGTRYMDIVQTINQELQSDPELIAYHNCLGGVNTVHIQSTANTINNNPRTLANKRKRLLWNNTTNSSQIVLKSEADTEGRTKLYYTPKQSNAQPRPRYFNRSNNMRHTNRGLQTVGQVPLPNQSVRPTAPFQRLGPAHTNQQVRPFYVVNQPTNPPPAYAANNQQRYPSTVRCFKCGKIGHPVQECRLRNATTVRQPVVANIQNVPVATTSTSVEDPVR